MARNLSDEELIPKDLPTDLEANDEAAGQEEIYLEETEERLRAMLIPDELL